MPDQAMNTRKRTLTEATIRAYVGTESFSRGERYFREGRIANGRRAGLTLTADCYGSK